MKFVGLSSFLIRKHSTIENISIASWFFDPIIIDLGVKMSSSKGQWLLRKMHLSVKMSINTQEYNDAWLLGFSKINTQWSILVSWYFVVEMYCNSFHMLLHVISYWCPFVLSNWTKSSRLIYFAENKIEKNVFMY